jgi:hypothetical protein
MTEQLLHLLQERANHRGQVIARSAWLEESLACSIQEIEPALGALVAAGKVEIVSPLPWLIVKVRKMDTTVASTTPSWSGSNPARVHSQQQSSSNQRSMHSEVPVSSAAAAAMQQREDGGAGEGEVLLGEVLAVLGPDADRDEFRLILAGQSSTLIRRCLKRVQATRSIRVSRAALFRSLLAKLS